MNYSVPPDLQRRIENGEAQEYEIPFVCDECGVFKQGGELSSKSPEWSVICMECHGRSKDEAISLLESKSTSVSKIMDDGDHDISTLVREAGIPDSECSDLILKIRELFEPVSRSTVQKQMRSTENLLRFRGVTMRSADYVWAHQDRVEAMMYFSQHLLSLTVTGFDFRKATFMARYHDASEGISPLGDIPTNLKAKLSPQSHVLLEKIERRCIELMSEPYYVEYDANEVKEIFTEALDKSTREGLAMKWFDMVDAYMVIMREMELGNTEQFLPIYERHLENMRMIRDGKKYLEIGNMLASIPWQAWNERLKELFDEQSDSLEHFRSSGHLFDLEALSTDMRKPDGKYDFPSAYSAWRLHIEKRKHAR